MNMRLTLSSQFRAAALTLIAGATLVGCGREEQAVVVRTVPKQPEPKVRVAGATTQPLAMQAQMPGGGIEPAGNQSGGSIEWTLPDGWNEQAGGGPMRFATIIVDPANPTVALTVIPLTGDSGGMLANVNRWRDQIKLGAIADADLSKNTTQFEVAGSKSYSVDLMGPESANPRQAMLAAAIPHNGQTWFLKLAGPASVVTPQKDKFQAFVKSVKFGAAGPNAKPPSAVAAELPAGHPAIPGSAAPGAAPVAAAAIPFTFDTPPGWVKDEPMPMRTVSFHIGESPSKVDVIVSQLPAMGSGVIENVNRWRGQIGLQPLGANEKPVSQPIKVGGSDGQQYDFVGPGVPAVAKRQVVAWVTRGGDWWFFKITGTDEQVSRQLGGFDSFLKSVQFIAANEAAAKP